MPSSACQTSARSEEHTSELQSHSHLVCRLLLEKKNTTNTQCCKGVSVMYGSSPFLFFCSYSLFFFFLIMRRPPRSTLFPYTTPFRSMIRRPPRSTLFPYTTLSDLGGRRIILVFTGMLDGTLLALDDQTLEEQWRFNVGTGFNAAPMTYAVNGKQYIAIASGVCCVRPNGQISNSLAAIRRNPELRDQ